MKVKILLGLALVLVLGVAYLSTKGNEDRAKDVKNLKQAYIVDSTNICLKKQKISIKNATDKQKEKCKQIANKKWQEAIVMNTEY
jgi:ABC-type transport system involved in cytochrome bd biosynthesis fused ATPase/permease subunit